ncbi:MAG: hypothetical protein ACI4JM_02665 [Oscillospiraceae bacterium]
MKSKKTSTLGYIMDFLNIQTTAMAKSLHVDPSLISKWKSGARQLTEQSVYFDDVIQFLLENSGYDDYTFNALERCIHKVPPERKERQSVAAFLTELAEELDTQINF